MKLKQIIGSLSGLILIATITAPPVRADEYKEEYPDRSNDRRREEYLHLYENSPDRRYPQIEIPRGHYPPPGECRIWNRVLPAGQQKPPVPCSSLPREVYGDGRIIIHSDGTQEAY